MSKEIIDAEFEEVEPRARIPWGHILAFALFGGTTIWIAASAQDPATTIGAVSAALLYWPMVFVWAALTSKRRIPQAQADALAERLAGRRRD